MDGAANFWNQKYHHLGTQLWRGWLGEFHHSLSNGDAVARLPFLLHTLVSYSVLCLP